MVISEFVKGVVGPVLDKFIPDAKERLEAEQMIFKQSHEVSVGQIEINKIEAQNNNLFVSGWRPFIGWVCGVTFAYSIMGRSFLNAIFEFFALHTGHSLPVLPPIDTTLTFELLMALLGLGGMRSWEKWKGLTK